MFFGGYSIILEPYSEKDEIILRNCRDDLSSLLNKENEFVSIRNNFEEVYAKSRNIIKPDNYILDQDHHNHTANQTLNMDWQFIAEIKLFEKINLTYK